MRTVRIELPLPPREASPNARCHWKAKARAVRGYRLACATLARCAGLGAVEPPVTVHLDFYLCRKAAAGAYLPLDEDNALASAKQVFDALVDAGIVRDDGRKYVRAGRVTLHRSRKEHGGEAKLVVTLEGAE